LAVVGGRTAVFGGFLRRLAVSGICKSLATLPNLAVSIFLVGSCFLAGFWRIFGGYFKQPSAGFTQKRGTVRHRLFGRRFDSGTASQGWRFGGIEPGYLYHHRGWYPDCIKMEANLFAGDIVAFKKMIGCSH
jgi:hypothetical protein